MEQILPEHWAFIFFSLFFSMTCGQMLVVYVLSDSNDPPAGLGLYTVYFMAVMLALIALTLQQGASIPLTVDVPALASTVTSYILFMAAGQRAGITRGRALISIICLCVCLSFFLLPPQRMFVLSISTATLFFVGTGLLCAWRGWQQRNIGDAIIACAALIMIVSIPTALYQLYGAANYPKAQATAFAAHSCAYALVATGFLASILVDYQQHLSLLATEDPLTRLLNRRGLEAALQISLANAARQELPTAAIMLDIDHFKKINDNFGHETGDHVIRQVAHILQNMTRKGDVIARTGGEEYLLILPSTNLDAAKALAERIRLTIEEQPLSIDYQRIQVTVSLGVASVMGEVDMDELSQEADRAMYLAKRGGRNRVASVENNPVHLSATADQA